MCMDGHLHAQLNRVIEPRGANALFHASRHAEIDAVMDGTRGPLDKMLAANVLACHCGAMEIYAMAASREGTGKANYLGLASKLSRTMAQLIDTIDRHKSGSPRKAHGDESDPS
jgi:hypothetical protein